MKRGRVNVPKDFGATIANPSSILVWGSRVSTEEFAKMGVANASMALPESLARYPLIHAKRSFVTITGFASMEPAPASTGFRALIAKSRQILVGP